jgi:eukaryotic translation initiation factor 2-alpha kinase 4
MPTVAVDVPTTIFDAMCRSSAWITEDDAWKSLVASFPGGHGYASQIRDLVLKHKDDGHAYILLFAVKEERIQLLALH